MRERSTRCPGSEEATVIVISGSGFHPLAGAGAAAPFAGPDALARLQIEPVCEAAADLWPEIGREFIDCPTHEGLSDLKGATTLSLLPHDHFHLPQIITKSTP